MTEMKQIHEVVVKWCDRAYQAYSIMKANLIRFQLVGTLSKIFTVSLIMEHPCDDEFIREQALMLLMSQCKDFDF